MEPTPDRQPAAAGHAATGTPFPSGGGEIGALIRAHDWAGQAIGAAAGWAQSLRTLVRFMLDSRYAMWMGWGPELTFFYNDAYARDTLGRKHPWALGRRADEVWAEIWPDIGPRIAQVLATGEATWDEGLLLFLERSGVAEETYHTFSYSPVYDDAAGGPVVGMFCVVTEETERVIGERRVKLLRDIATALNGAQTPQEVYDAVGRCLGTGTPDLPFVLVFDEPSAGGGCVMCTQPQCEPRMRDRGTWLPTQDSADSLLDAAALGLPLPPGPWKKPPAQVLVLPLQGSADGRGSGALVAGLNPHRPHDEGQAAFVRLLAGQASAALANARSRVEAVRRAQALAELDRAKTTFFSNVSHELRTPLTLMLGPVEEALTDAAHLPLLREKLELAHRNSLRLLKLVNSLLDFARIEAGRAQIHLEPTDLARTTAELASVFRAAIERAGLALRLDCPSLPWPVAVDRDAWEKVVLNLLSNAFKFTFEGEIEVALRAVGAQAELTVRDTGVGIPEQDLPHVFERFRRVEGSRGRTHEGTGIGLALVQELVKLHGGTIDVQSVSGHGTRFTVRLPAHGTVAGPGPAQAAVPSAIRADAYVQEALRWLPGESAAPPGEPTATIPAAFGFAAGAAPAPGARVLLADDNADMRQYVSRFLQPWWKVEAVADGQAALEAARRERPDLVLSDVMMPRLDGFGLLAALRADPTLADVPVILLSARAGEESRVEGMGRGADDYLVKPFAARELLACVGAHLELARVSREAGKAVLASRAQLEQVLRSIRDQFIALDAQWRYVFVNDRVCEVTRLTREQLIGQSIWEVFPALVGTAFETSMRRAAAARTPLAFDSESRDGLRAFANHAYPSEDGGMVVLVIEITERRRRETLERFIRWIAEELSRDADPAELMRAVGERLGEQLRLSSCAFNEIDDDLGVTTVPYGWFRSGVPSLVGGVYRHEDYVAPALPAANWAGEVVAVADTLQDERTRAEAYRPIGLRAFITVPFRRDSRWRFTLAVTDDRPRRWRADEIELVRAVAERVFPRLERARAEAAAREAERRLRLAGSAARLGYWSWDLETHAVEIDGACKALFGLEAPDVVPLGSAGSAENRYASRFDVVKARIHPEDHAGLEQSIAQAVAGTAPYDTEFRVCHPDGRVRWLAGKGDVLRDAGGRAIRMVGVNLDVTVRRAVEQALRDSEERYRILFENMADGFSLVSMVYASDEDRALGRHPIDYRFLVANPAFAAHAGLEHVAGRSVLELVPSLERRWIDTFGQVARTGEPVRLEDHVAAWGRTFDVYAFRVGDPHVREVAVFFRDVTARRRADEALAQARRRVDSALLAGNVATYEWDILADRVRADRNFAPIFGVEAPQDTGTPLHTFLEAIDPEDVPEVRRRIQRTLEGLEPFAVEYRIRHAQRGERWLDVRGDVVARDASGRAVLWSGVLLDITDRKAVESALRRSEQRFRSMADTAPAMLWVTGRDNALEFISRAWFGYTGQSEEAAYRGGMGWTQMVHEEDRDAAERGFAEAAQRRQPFELQYRLHRADGTYRWAIDAGQPHFDDDGQWQGYIGSVIDVHEQSVALQALREADRRKDEFLATLAHELRNPLAPIRNALHLFKLAGGAVPTERIRDMLERQIGHLVRLVDDLMEASRISRGQLELKREVLDLADVLRHAIETSKPLIDRAHHRVELRLPPQPLQVYGDSVRLGQVFANLLNNAAKYTDDGGLIEVDTRSEDAHAMVTEVAPEDRSA